MVKSKIVVISGKNPLESYGGYAVYSYGVIKVLFRLGYEVDVYCIGAKTSVKQKKWGRLYACGSPLAGLSFFKGMEMAGLIFFAPVLAWHIFKREKASGRVFIWGIGPWSLAGVIAKLFLGRKTTVLSDYFTTIRHEYFGSRVVYWSLIQVYASLEWFTLHISDKILTHYNSSEKILTGEFGNVGRKFVKLPYTLQIPERRVSKVQGRKLNINNPLVLLVSRHDERKGIKFLLEAFKILNDRGLKYEAVIAGGGRLLEKHIQLAAEFGLQNVTFVGPVANTKPYFKRANIFVLSSLEEGGSSLALIEAMKWGIAIVSTNVDGIPEDLQGGKSGILVRPGDSMELAQAISRLLKNPALAKRLGRNAKLSFKQRFGEEKTAAAVSKMLSGFFVLADKT